MPPKVFEIYNGFKYHIAMDITAMDSTMPWVYMRMLKKIRNHSTGQSTVSPNNTIYYLTLYVEAWVKLTGMPAANFFKYNYITAYGDDNVLSTNIYNDKWNAKNLVSYFVQKGIPLKVEYEQEVLNSIEFLNKQYYNKNMAKDHFEFGKSFKSSIIICKYEKDILSFYNKYPKKFILLQNLISPKDVKLSHDIEYQNIVNNGLDDDISEYIKKRVSLIKFKDRYLLLNSMDYIFDNIYNNKNINMFNANVTLYYDQ
ncbi:1673_t:CDS:2 [Gigaspora rosea]|nr:1673_t:CDS:2 [Gigaspora rosea]